MTSKLLTIREVAHCLNITEKEVIELTDSGVIPAYKVGGVYLRYKKDQIDEAKDKIKPNQSLVSIEGTPSEKVKDFFHHYDFYVLSLIITIVLLYLIVQL